MKPWIDRDGVVQFFGLPYKWGDTFPYDSLFDDMRFEWKSENRTAVRRQEKYPHLMKRLWGLKDA